MTLTIKEYSEKEKISKQAVLYRIKKKQIQAKKIKGVYVIFLDKKNSSAEEKTPDKKYQNENEVLKEKIKGLEESLKNKDLLLEAKEQVIEAERRTNIALLHNLENGKSDNQKILEEKPKKGLFKKLLFWKN